jgi:hypothetical protein
VQCSEHLVCVLQVMHVDEIEAGWWGRLAETAVFQDVEASCSWVVLQWFLACDIAKPSSAVYSSRVNVL